jgi:PIN domain nuclease of toxin-antitoxin system
MKLLLDTHIFLWYISGDHHLPKDLKDIIQDPMNEVSLRHNGCQLTKG